MVDRSIVCDARIDGSGQRQERRRITILDAMIFFAATALGLTLCRETLGSHWRHFETGSWTDINLVSFLVAAWTLGVVALRVIPPRPSFRDLTRQPGTMACLVALLVIALKAVYWQFIVARAGWHNPGNEYYVRYDTVAMESGSVGAAVLISWLALALTCTRRAEPSWVDRGGRVLGAYWVVLFIMVSWYGEKDLRRTLTCYDISERSFRPPPVTTDSSAATALPEDATRQPPVMIDIFPADDEFSVAPRRSQLFSDWAPGIPGPPASFPVRAADVPAARSAAKSAP
jgi:hypothetical protein